MTGTTVDADQRGRGWRISAHARFTPAALLSRREQPSARCHPAGRRTCRPAAAPRAAQSSESAAPLRPGNAAATPAAAAARGAARPAAPPPPCCRSRARRTAGGTRRAPARGQGSAVRSRRCQLPQHTARQGPVGSHHPAANCTHAATRRACSRQAAGPHGPAVQRFAKPTHAAASGQLVKNPRPLLSTPASGRRRARWLPS